jgi:hypothetical protein
MRSICQFFRTMRTDSLCCVHTWLTMITFIHNLRLSAAKLTGSPDPPLGLFTRQTQLSLRTIEPKDFFFWKFYFAWLWTYCDFSSVSYFRPNYSYKTESFIGIKTPKLCLLSLPSQVVSPNSLTKTLSSSYSFRQEFHLAHQRVYLGRNLKKSKLIEISRLEFQPCRRSNYF